MDGWMGGSCKVDERAFGKGTSRVIGQGSHVHRPQPMFFKKQLERASRHRD